MPRVSTALGKGEDGVAPARVRSGVQALRAGAGALEAGAASVHLRVALMGTRGVPAAYGGFETAVEEIGRRLAARGHEVTVYCRTRPGRPRPAEHLGMRLVHLPSVRKRALETLSHTALSTAHAVLKHSHDVGIVFNAANAPFLPVLRAGGLPIATHVDGLEWRRDKWGPTGKSYYRMAEALAVRWSDALIADAQGIADYYRAEFGADTELIAYGAPIQRDVASHRLAELGVEPGCFHLVVARFEPENHVLEAIEGYLRSSAREPLLVVGSAPYSADYTRRIRQLAATDDRVKLLGAVWDQEKLDQLYAHALTYVHGHSVGGTNPSLLRAMGAGTAVLAYEVNFNCEVLGEHCRVFGDPAGLAELLEAAEQDREGTVAAGADLRERAERLYRWDDVALAYEDLCLRLVAGTTRSTATGRRVRAALTSG